MTSIARTFSRLPVAGFCDLERVATRHLVENEHVVIFAATLAAFAGSAAIVLHAFASL